MKSKFARNLPVHTVNPKLGNIKPNHFVNNYHMFHGNPLIQKHSCVHHDEKQIEIDTACSEQSSCECSTTYDQVCEVMSDPMPELHEIYQCPDQEVINEVNPIAETTIESITNEPDAPKMCASDDTSCREQLCSSDAPKMYHVVSQVLAKIKLKKQSSQGWQI
jgi:hypothetical protein